ncbi:hypothetical protein KGQ20_23780 [Catenulispora sp. NF23]|uniref:Integral membrane protein n=1 Tax=Catenulispora pinistramenti TaxID=2705254 RepID=A0ABS5L1T3_9ACTN|nr:hypothetical protein [Catenulispora pinistramenti]MBS2535787.1 hypothetical protein [Catenulispora pinistramenti]MBS2552276.1 hypothetical protein [Catenulispora pinistramenti]
MARPTDWDILDLDHDPTPGDPYLVQEISRKMRDIGDEAERAARDVRGLAGDNAVMGWIGASGDAFRDHIGKFPGQLDKVATSHHMCADALTRFGNALDGFQSQADRALAQARPLRDQIQRIQSQLASAHTDLDSSNRGVTAAQAAATVDPAHIHNAIQAQTTAQNTVNTLNSQLSGPASQLEGLKKLAAQAESLRHAAEDTASTKIHAAADAGIPPDSFWHKLGEVASALWHGLVIVAKIVSIVGAIVLMVVGGPLWLIVAVVAAGVIILADTLYKYANGKASLWDVGLSILGCIPITKGITSLAALSDAFRAGGLLGAGLHLGGAALGTAKDMISGITALLRAGKNLPTIAVAAGKMFGEGNDVVKLSLKAFADGRPGFTLFNDADPLTQMMQKIKPIEGYFDVGAHGYPDAIGYQFRGALDNAVERNDLKNWLNLSHDNLANLIRNNGWDGKSPIRLLSCSTGKAADGFAQNLANKLGVPVLAPNDVLWVRATGHTEVAPVAPSVLKMIAQGKNVMLRPDRLNLGSFVTFFPKKP